MGTSAMKTVLPLLLSLLAAFAGAENLNLLSTTDGKMSAVLTTNDRAPDPTRSGAFRGTGSIAITFGGAAMPPIGPMPYNGLIVNGSQVSGGSFSIVNDSALANVFGTGLNLVLRKGTSLTLTGPAPATLALTGSADIALPFKDINGAAVKGGVTQFWLNSLGATALKAAIDVSGPIKLPGVTIAAGQFTLNYTGSPGTAPTVAWTCPSANVDIGLPGATTNDDQPITLACQNVTFDADGLLSIGSSSLYRPVTVSLAEPSNFTLNLVSAAVKMDHSSITAGEFKGSLTLPPLFSSTDKSSGRADPVRLDSIDIKVANDQAVLSAGSDAIDLYWNGFHLNVPAATGQPSFIVDLSNTLSIPGELDPDGKALPASWQGLYIRKASLQFPTSFGSDAKVDMTNLLVDSGGISGKFTAASAQQLAGFSPPGFPGHLESLSLSFLQSHLADFEASGAIEVGGDMGSIGVKVDATEAGAFSLTLSQDAPVTFSSLGVQLQIDQGTFAIDSKGVPSLDITGAFAVPDNATGVMAFLKGTTFAVKDLKVASNGKMSVSSAWLDLPHPESVSLGPVSVALNQLGIGQDSQSRVTLSLTGDVAIKELPISGQIGFDGLTIGAGPTVTWGGIHLSASVAGVASIEADIEHTTMDGKTAGAAYPDWQKYNGPPLDVYSGDATLSLDCFGPSGAFGGSLQFMVARTGWYVIGSASIGSGIQLGPTPLSLFGFEGGFGHDVEPDTPGATGVPGQDYKLIPFAPGQAGDEWMLLAGVRIGTSDEYTAWGDLVLSLMFGNALIIDLNGKVELMEPAASYPMGSDLPEDRELVTDIHYDGPSKTFHASAAASFYLPDKATYSSGIGIMAAGNVDLLLSPSDKHFFIGGPIAYTTGQQPRIDNPVTVGVMGITGSQAALDVDLNSSANTLSLSAATILGFSFSESAGPFSVSLTDQQWFYGGLIFDTNPPGLQRGDLALGIDASGQFSFSCWLFSINIGAGVDGDLYGQIDRSKSGGYDVTVGGDLNVWVEACGVGGNIGVHFQLGS